MAKADKDTKELARKLNYALIAKAAEARSMSLLRYLSEATFQDALLHPCIAHASQSGTKGWAETETALTVESTKLYPDLMVKQQTSHGNVHTIGVVEVKWWRGGQGFNATNRRSDLFKDMLRASAFRSVVKQFALVCLVSTQDAWDNVLSVNKPESQLLRRLDVLSETVGVVPKNDFASVVNEISKPASRPKVPIASKLHVSMIHKCTLSLDDTKDSVTARCWLVRKPENSHWL